MYLSSPPSDYPVETFETIDVKPCVEELAADPSEYTADLSHFECSSSTRANFIASAEELFLNGFEYSQETPLLLCKVCSQLFDDLDILKCHMVRDCKFFQIAVA